VHDEIGAFPVDTRLFAPSSFFDVFVDITIDGGTGGTASLDGSVTNQFVRDQATAVPEPSAMLLVGSGLFGMWARRRRRVPTQ
jgi:hypothetical protein